MENASKALLIAAAVLIVVLIITFGISVFNSSADTTEEVDQLGYVISSKSDAATKEILESTTDSNNTDNAEKKAKKILNSKNLDDPSTFTDYLKDNYPDSKSYSADEVRTICYLIMQRSEKLFGKIYYANEIHVTSGSTGCPAIINIIDPNNIFFQDNLDDSKRYTIEYKYSDWLNPNSYSFQMFEVVE